ncbi:hypothetical protein EJB05_16002, partial [Eragrostis curvula]
MARAHPTSTPESSNGVSSMASSPALLHAAWITAAVAVCLALCTIHSRKLSSLSLRRRGSSSSSRSCASSRESNAGGTVGAGGATASATPAAKVSPTPSETPKANGGAGTPRAAAAAAAEARQTDGGANSSGGPITVIDVGTHGPIAPVFPAPDPIPPRRSLSLSAKHIRFAERLGRIRSMRRGSGEAAAAEDDVGARAADDDDDDDRTLWTKTIILGERCRVPAGDVMVPWKSYRPRQPRSVPVTRSNSFAGVGACRRADARY